MRRAVHVPIADLTIAGLEEFCETARKDGATGKTPVRLVETAPFIKSYRLQTICPAYTTTPKD